MLTETIGKSCCSCGCDCAFEKKVVVEYLYLDLQTCERCIGTDSVLDEVMLVLTPAIELAGYTVEYRKVEMKTAEIAKQHQFASSPTIRVNGQDICRTVAEKRPSCSPMQPGCDAIASKRFRCYNE